MSKCKTARKTCAQLVKTLIDGEYVIVSHGGVIAALLADALEADYDSLLRTMRLDNAGVSVFEFNGNSQKPTILWINKTTHLEGLLSPNSATIRSESS